jgi:hypothetical protein
MAPQRSTTDADMDRRSWMSGGVPTPKFESPLCSQTDPEVFTGIKHGETWKVRAARQICGNCVELVKCREWALHPDNTFLEGVVGGLTSRDRRSIRRERRKELEAREAAKVSELVQPEDRCGVEDEAEDEWLAG